MKMTSIRIRLPISYALIALLTAVVLGSILILTLQSFYQNQEYNYLSSNAALMVPGITSVIEEEQDPASLQIYIQNLSYLIQARIRLMDSDNNVLADSGSLQTQQFIYTNLTPEGMSADILREGKSDRYLFFAKINVIEHQIDGSDFGLYPVFLSQMPLQPALFGIDPGTQGSQNIQHTDQIYTTPIISSSNQVLGTLEVSEGLAIGGTIIENVTQAWYIASVIAIIVAGVSGWLVSLSLIAPLTELTNVTKQMAAGNLSYRTDIKTKDEFNSLGLSFNTMAENLESNIYTLRSFVADAAHELLTPVAALSLNLELAEDDPNNQFLSEAQAQTIRLQALVDSLLDLSRIEATKSQHAPIFLIRLINEVVNEFTPAADKKNINISILLPEEEVSIFGDAAQIKRAIENILDNAIKFSKLGGEVDIRITEKTQAVQISIKDKGIGILGNDLPNVSQRFFRGRNTSAFSGSGLGLAIVKAIADQHKAKLNIESDLNGTKITLIFNK